MKNNKISKITMLASLLVAGMVNAQEFYTCVPKKDWWIDIVKQANKKEWKEIIHLTSSSHQNNFTQTLNLGRYKVRISTDGSGFREEEFILNKSEEFKACVGSNSGGGNGYNGSYKGGITDITGYGEGEVGKRNSVALYGGKGCYGGYILENTKISGGGSYFSIADVKLILSGRGIFLNGNFRPRNEGDPYITIYKLE